MKRIDRETLDVCFKYFLEDPSKVCNDLVSKMQRYTLFESIDWGSEHNMQLYNYATLLFDNEDEFIKWFVHENKDLFGFSPLEQLKRSKNTLKIIELLKAIEKK